MADLKYSLGIVCLFVFLDSVFTGTSVSITDPATDITKDIQHDAPTGESVQVVISTNLVSYTFSQSPDDGTFTADDSVYPALAITVAQAPSASTYTLTVTALGSDGSTDTRIITVNVIGAGNPNLHAPVFEALSGAVKIVEDATSGTSVVTVRATDADTTSPENEVSYSLDQGGPTFTIDSTTGLIKVGTTLDYTAQNTYELVVIATDGASSPQSATLTATVSVQTRPQWNLATNTVTIPENTSVSTEIATLAATDEDNSGGIQYSIVSQSPGTMFTVVGDKVKSISTFDVDGQTGVNSYTVTLRLSDGDYTATTDETITVTVTDVNDSPPVFDPSEYSVDVETSKTSGSHVITVTATDADATAANNVVEYSLRTADTAAFSIDPVSGLITVNDAARLVDYAENKYIVAIATDSGSPVNTASATVKINENSGVNIFHGVRWHAFISVSCWLLLVLL